MHNASEMQPQLSDSDGITIYECINTSQRCFWFRAKQMRLDRQIALKWLHPAIAENASLRDNFIQAGQQAATIVHPAALAIINVFPHQHCIAMQWRQGECLRNHTRPLDSIKAANIGITVMDCLSVLHATGRCHGNLSAGNIFFDGDGGIGVNDFFHLPLVRNNTSSLQDAHEHIAPEVLHGAACDWRGDVFSLGKILQYCLAGRKYSRELRDVLDTMCTPDPSHRGDSPATVLTRLQRSKQVEESLFGRQQAQVKHQRKYRRVPGEFTVKMCRRSATPGETAVLLNRIRDIGESGVFVETDDTLLNVGSILELDFSLHGVQDNVHAFGVVRWKSAPPMPQGVGVQFLEVDQSGLLRLRKFLEKK